MPARSDYPKWPQVTGAYERIAERVGALPGVTGVALAANHPLERGFTSQVTVVGRPEPEGSIEETRVHPVSAEYHRLLRVPLVAGRHLAASDRPGAVPVVVVNQAFARKHFAGGNPLGERVNLWGRELQIVGVVGDVRFQGLAEASEPAIHPPLPQFPFSGFRLLVSATVSPAALERSVRAAMAELEPDVALHEVAPLEELLARSYGERRFVMVLLATFGALAAALAALGIYGVMAFQAAQRRREMGVRQALGAARGDLVRLLAGEGARLTVAGALLGLAASAALTRSLQAFLFEVAPLDPLALAAAAALLVGMSLVAAWLPARRASRVDPMEVLREEGG
jgi:predicted permease